MDVFIVGFAVDNITSFWNVKDKWIPLIKKYNSEASIIIAGHKCDSFLTPQITNENCKSLVEITGACFGILFSSVTCFNLKYLFEVALFFGCFGSKKASKIFKPKQTTKCSIQ